MSCSVIIQDMRRECERRVYVDSEEELKNMNVEEFIRRFCPDDERRRNCIYFIFKELEDDQTRGLRSTVTEYLNYDKTLGYHGIRKGSTIIEMDFSYVVTAPPADEDEDEGFSDHP